MHAIEIGGDRYIKAADAAALTGYTTDYIGQLSRGKKVSAERVGRAWYVSESDILDHKKGIKRSNKRKTQKAIKQELEEQGKIYNAYFDPTQENIMPEYRKRLLATEVRYEGDASPLTPSPIKESRLSEISIGENIENTLENQEFEPTETPEEVSIRRDSATVSEYISPQQEEVTEIAPAISEVDAETEESIVEITAKPQQRVKRPEKISPIPLQKGLPVPYGQPSYALVPVAARFVASLALILAFMASISGVFVQKVMVYEHGSLSISRPSYEISYGMRNVASIIESLPIKP